MLDKLKNVPEAFHKLIAIRMEKRELAALNPTTSVDGCARMYRFRSSDIREDVPLPFRTRHSSTQNAILRPLPRRVFPRCNGEFQARELVQRFVIRKISRREEHRLRCLTFEMEIALGVFVFGDFGEMVVAVLGESSGEEAHEAGADEDECHVDLLGSSSVV